MKPLHRTLLTAGLLASLGIGAIAQTQTPPAAPAGPGNAPHQMRGDHGRMDPQRMEERRVRMEERRAKRLAAFKQKLQITSAQEGAWTSWSGAIQPVRFQRPDRAEMQRLATPERIDRMRALRSQRQAEMDKRMDATKTFYAALNAEQKKVFDAEGLRYMRGGKRGGHGGHHGRYRG